MRIARLFTLISTLAIAPACVISSGRLEANRFQHATYPYALFYPEGGRAESPLGPHYRLENFRSPDGQHRYQKAGEGYVVERTYADETPNVMQRELFYDLLMSRDEPQAAFWIRSVPLRAADAQLPLAALAQRYLDQVAVVGRVAAPLGVEPTPRATETSQIRNVRTSECELSKRPAVRIDFEIENKAAARSIQEPEWKAGSVVLIQSGYFARRDYPVILLAGRSSAPNDAAVLEADFERMLERLVLGDKGQGLSMKGGHTCHAGGGTSDINAQAIAPAPANDAPHNTVDQLEVPIIQEGPLPDTSGGEEPQQPPTAP